MTIFGHVEKYSDGAALMGTAGRFCPGSCSLAAALHCSVREWRRLLDDLFEAQRTGSPDAEVLRADVAVADARIDALLRVGVALERVAR